MPSKRPHNALRDMQYHIDLAESFAADIDYPGFANDLRCFYAVTRCLEIISESSRRLPDEVKARHPSIAWRNMAGAGNIYRHDYEDVAARFVWDTLKRHLPPLRAVIVEELLRLGETP